MTPAIGLIPAIVLAIGVVSAVRFTARVFRSPNAGPLFHTTLFPTAAALLLTTMIALSLGFLALELIEIGIAPWYGLPASFAMHIAGYVLARTLIPVAGPAPVVGPLDAKIAGF